MAPPSLRSRRYTDTALREMLWHKNQVRKVKREEKVKADLSPSLSKDAVYKLDCQSGRDKLTTFAPSENVSRIWERDCPNVNLPFGLVVNKFQIALPTCTHLGDMLFGPENSILTRVNQEYLNQDNLTLQCNYTGFTDPQGNLKWTCYLILDFTNRFHPAAEVDTSRLMTAWYILVHWVIELCIRRPVPLDQWFMLNHQGYEQLGLMVSRAKRQDDLPLRQPMVQNERHPLVNLVEAWTQLSPDIMSDTNQHTMFTIGRNQVIGEFRTIIERWSPDLALTGRYLELWVNHDIFGRSEMDFEDRLILATTIWKSYLSPQFRPQTDIWAVDVIRRSYSRGNLVQTFSEIHTQ